MSELDDAYGINQRDFYKELINRANSVPITYIFKHYGIRLNETTNKIVCPFPSHKSGRENTPSLKFYPHTNSFWCFGCNVGRGCCDFVAAMEAISKAKAAYKIIETFNDISSIEDIDQVNYSERLEIMLGFSNFVREFRQSNFKQSSDKFIEDICAVYDSLNIKHDLSNDALKSIVEQLKNEIDSF